MRKVQLCTLLSVQCALLSVLCFAQAPVGTITGTVSDESGAVIPNASVTITNKETGFLRVFTTGQDGVFSAPALAAGTYVVKTEMQGFRTIVREALVETGSTTTADIRMQVGQQAEIVSVEAATAQIEYERHTIDGVITRKQIQELPLNGRSFLQLAFLEPGITVSANNQGQYNRAFDVSVLGGNSDTTRITVDGAIINDSVTGGTQQNFSQEVVQEFQVSSVNFDLSTGIAAGGAINIVTRTGTNDFHGSAFFFFRDHNMAAYPALKRSATTPDPFFARRQPGFWIGGPVKKDKLFFFANYEHNNQSGVFSAVPNSPEFQNFTTVYPSPFHGTQVGARIDYRINEKHTAFIRYSHDGNDSFAPRSGNSLPSNWVSNLNYADSGVFALTSSLTPSLVNEFRYSMTFWSNKNNTPSAAQCPGCIDLGGPQITIGDAGVTMGNTTNAPQSRVLRRHIFADNFSWQLGKHRIRIGGEFEHNRGTGTYAYAEPAAINLFSPNQVRALAPQFVPLLPTSYNTLSDILKLPFQSFAVGVGDINQPPSYNFDKATPNNRLHLYLQDTWKITPKFTLNYGLAYSWESNLLNYDLTKPAYLAPIFGAGGLTENHANLHITPSLGFAWNIGKDNKTVIRGGAGIYYDTYNIELRLIERAIIGPLGTGRVLIGSSSIPNPFPGVPGVPVGTPLNFSTPTLISGGPIVAALPQIRALIAQTLHQNPNNTDLTIRNINVFKTGTELMAQNFVPPSAQHLSIGFQHQITSDLVISADYVYRHFLHTLIRNAEMNHYQSKRGPVIPFCTSAAQAANPFAECSTGAIEVSVSGGRATYEGLLVKLDKRFSHRFQGQVSYALQNRTQTNAVGIYNNDNWFASQGPVGPRQILNVSGVIDIPWGFQASFISSTQSKGFYTPNISGVDLTGSGIDGFPLPGAGINRGNNGLSSSDLQKLVDQYNATYAGKPAPNPYRPQVFPTVVLPPNYSFGSVFNSQDLRLTKKFTFAERYKFDIFGEVFNLFNIANLGGFSTTLDTKVTSGLQTYQFGQATSRAGNIFGSGGPRAFQVGARFSF